MSVYSRNNSTKNIVNEYITSIKFNSNNRSNSVENNRKHSEVKCLYKRNDQVYNKNLLILNYIMTNSKKKHSIKTAFSDTNYENDNKNYDLNMINKYEENLNSSLSFISEFDLENDNDIKEDNSFNSENDDDDDSVEEIEINSKCNKNIREKRNEEDEFDIKLDQDFIEIKKKLLSSKDY